MVTCKMPACFCEMLVKQRVRWERNLYCRPNAMGSRKLHYFSNRLLDCAVVAAAVRRDAERQRRICPPRHPARRTKEPISTRDRDLGWPCACRRRLDLTDPHTQWCACARLGRCHVNDSPVRNCRWVELDLGSVAPLDHRLADKFSDEIASIALSIDDPDSHLAPDVDRTGLHHESRTITGDGRFEAHVSSTSHSFPNCR